MQSLWNWVSPCQAIVVIRFAGTITTYQGLTVHGEIHR